MKLDIISPKETTSHTVAWVELNTMSGNLVIHRGHAPTVFVLSENKPAIFKLSTGKELHVTVPSGVAEVTRDGISLLIAESP